MSVQEQMPIVVYVANGNTNRFAITFDLHDQNYLVVTLNNEVAQVGSYSVLDGEVVFGTAPADGSLVTLYRDTQLNRTTDYKSYDNSFRPESVNWDFDKLWHVLQEQNLIDGKILARIKDEIEWRRTHDFNYDELAQVREKQLFDALKGYADTLYSATNPNVFAGVIAGVVFARDGKSIQTHLEEILETLAQERENIDLKADQTYVEEQLDLKANQATTYTKIEVDNALSTKAPQSNTYTKAEVDTTFAAYAGGRKAYTTLALAQADQANLPANTAIEVTNDPTSSNNGTYQWNGTTLTKSAYDPLAQAKNYADANPMFKPINITTAINLNTITTPTLATVTQPTNITLALNFPVAGAIGTLEVLQGGSSATVFQKYTLIDGNVYVRGYTSGSWSAWVSQSVINKSSNETNGAKVSALEDLNSKAFTISTNLFDGAELNKSVSVTGEVIDEAGRWLSGYFPIMAGEVFKIPNSSYRIAYYTENKTFLNRTGVSDTVNAAAGIERGYFRLSGTNNLATMQLNKGTTLLPYEPHYIDLKNPQAKPPIEPSDTVFFDRSKNLFDKSEVLLGKSVDLSGNIVDDTRWLGGYIPCAANEVFSVPDDSFRIAYYDANKNFIVRSGGGGGGSTSFTVPNVATIAYMRLSGLYDLDLMQVNRGATLLDYDTFGLETLKKEYLPTDLDIDTDALKEEIISEISVSNYEPSTPTLTLTKVEETWRQPLWLSSDGSTLYGAMGGQLLQSTDDWVTRVNIGAALPKTILAVRVAGDGQLLAATVRDEADGTVAKVYKTIGYDRANPSAATFKEVLAINSTQANITNQWGFSVYNNIVTVSEYGLRGDNGAKNVYLSKDNGDTFSLIFNQYTQVVEGRPPLTQSAHMHTAAYDPYYNRIWVVVGDNPNTATYYSDDLGVTWVFVTGSTGAGAIQYTGIQALPDCVIFGSDRSPNGIYVYRRNGKDKMPVIKPLLTINSSTELTHVFGLPFKRDWSPTTPTYFAADRTDGTQFKPMITATVDGKKGHIMGELGAGEALHGIFGATASGKIIVVSQTSTSAGVIISTANAPTWSKV